MNQLLSLIPKWLVKELAEQHGADRYCKNFFSYDHLVTMLYSTFSQCGSLRELISGLQVNQHRLLHLGLLRTPCRSTLADASMRRPEAFFEELFHRLYQFHMGDLPDSRLGRKDIWSRLFIIRRTADHHQPVHRYDRVWAATPTTGAERGVPKRMCSCAPKRMWPASFALPRARRTIR